MSQVINKSMDREDLLTPEGQEFVAELSRLYLELERRQMPVTSWYGHLPEAPIGFSAEGMKSLARKLLGRSTASRVIGEENRGGPSYEPVPGIARDHRHPWFLYWEAFWVMSHGPRLNLSDRVLDAGGTASLFSCYLASRGAEVHSVDLNENLVQAGNAIARGMGWKMESHCMNMVSLEFPDEFFDHAYSICVFEHLNSDLRQKALVEIARTLKPGGRLSITFDFRGPGVSLVGEGPNYDRENLIRSREDVERHFLSNGLFELVGNEEFEDNGNSYLVWPSDPSQRYTFGALFLRKSG
jgi:SAM-dependent methyltransferase